MTWSDGTAPWAQIALRKVQVSASHATATHADPDLAGTGLRILALDPAQRADVNRPGVIDNPSFHEPIIALRRGLPQCGLGKPWVARRPVRLRGGNSQQTGHRAKRMPSIGAARHFRPRIHLTSSAAATYRDLLDLLARHRLYGSNSTTAAGTTHHAGTDA